MKHYDNLSENLIQNFQEICICVILNYYQIVIFELNKLILLKINFYCFLNIVFTLVMIIIL